MERIEAFDALAQFEDVRIEVARRIEAGERVFTKQSLQSVIELEKSIKKLRGYAKMNNEDQELRRKGECAIRGAYRSLLKEGITLDEETKRSVESILDMMDKNFPSAPNKIIVAEIVAEKKNRDARWQKPNDANTPKIEIEPSVLADLEKHKIITQKPLKWLMSKSLFAYFVDIYTEKYNVKTKSNGRKMLKPFEVMFEINNLRGRINDYKKGGDLPVDYKTIDEILNWK